MVSNKRVNNYCQRIAYLLKRIRNREIRGALNGTAHRRWGKYRDLTKMSIGVNYLKIPIIRRK